MLKNRLEREIENAKRQLEIYDGQLKEAEEKTIELEQKNQQYTSDLAAINKQVQEKEKEVEEISQKIRDIRLEHGSSDARQIKLLEQKVRQMLSQFFQNCKKHKIRRNASSQASSNKKNDVKGQKSQMNLEEIQEIASQVDLNNLSSDRKFLNGGNNKQNENKQSKLQKAQLQSQEINFDFVIKVINGQQINDVPIDLNNIIKVSNLRDYLAKTYSIQKEFLFLYDESGNMLLDEMNLETSLFPNVFKTIKNYVPTLRIEVKRQKSKKNNNGEQKEFLDTLMTGNDDAVNDENQLKIAQLKKMNKKQDNKWNAFVQKIPKLLKSLQHILENLAILVLIVLFILNRYIGDEVINKFNINKELEKELASIQFSNDNPFSDQNSLGQMIEIVYGFSVFNNPGISFTSLIPSIAVQERMNENTDCPVSSNHKTMYNFDGKIQGCVDFGSTNKDNYGTTSPFKYDTLKGTDLSGFILKIPEDLKYMSIDEIDTFSQTWVDYRTKKVTFYLNFFNSPSQMVAQTKMEVTNIQTDGKIQDIKLSINSFSVEPEKSSEKIIANCVTGIASFLLLFALIEYIGIYGSATTNITILLYIKRKEDYDKMKDQEKRDHEEFIRNFGDNANGAVKAKKFQSKLPKLDDHQFKIIDLSWLYILIKRPEFFDIINIISLIVILVQSGIYSNFRKKREGIINPNQGYIHLDSYISEDFIINMLTAINTLLLMLSFTKYLASWSFTLKIYSQIITQFVKNSWSLIFVVLSIILAISFSWLTFIDGSLKNHDNFIYSIFAQIKATFYASFIQDLRIDVEKTLKPEMTPTQKKAVFNPFVIIVMLIIQLVIHFSIFSFLASLMAHSIHVTKERMEQISKEIQDFEKRKVVSSTVYFRKSMQNQYNPKQPDK